jgi:Ca2+-transporting ATPase
MNFDFNKYSGLTKTEVEESRLLHGSNELTLPERLPWWKLLFEKFNDPIIRILMIAALIAMFVGFFDGSYIEGVGIISAILLATLMAFFNEFKAGREFDILNKVNDEVAVKVIREGNVTTVPRRQVVVNDLVIVDQGEEVAADGIILESVSLAVNESSLTGEPIAYKSENQQFAEKEATFPSNRLYKGTIVTEGYSVIRVSAVGNNTEIGKTARQASLQINEPTPLGIQLKKLSKLIGVVGFAVAIIAFWALLLNDYFTGKIQLSRGNWFSLICILVPMAVLLVRVWLPIFYDFLDLFRSKVQRPVFLNQEISKVILKLIFLSLSIFILLAGFGFAVDINIFHPHSWFSLFVGERLLLYFMVSITLIVVAVPEGLAMSVTLSLAYSMRRMTATNNLVRQMHATETMGATTVICTDKTGTLTKNQMRIGDSYFFKTIPFEFDIADSNIYKLSMAANSTAHLDFTESQIKTVGNPTDAALLIWLNDNNIDYRSIRSDFNIKNQIAFSSENKFMASFGFSTSQSKWFILLKGAPEVVFERCDKVLVNNQVIPINEVDIEYYHKKLSDIQSKGIRTISFAYLETTSETERPNGIIGELNNMVLLGFVGIADPVRDDVANAVTECNNAGIRVKVITGDTLITAKDICQQVGLCHTNVNESTFISGVDFANLNEEEAMAISKILTVMFRARPTDKLRLVTLLQKAGEVVAVTGDGTNDAPALNKANVGLAMGSGTSIAREASDIILLDDSFTSIVNAVRWGRSLYLNIQRFLFFQLTINLLALAIVLFGPVVGVTLPLTVIQMLWVNLIMDTFAALALATEPPQTDVMRKAPRKPTDFILTPQMQRGIISTAIVFFIFLITFLKHLNHDGTITNYELTIFFNVFVMLQFWNLFNARSFGTQHSAFAGLAKNIGFIIIAFVILLGQVLIVQYGGQFFRTEPLPVFTWITIILFTSPVLWVGELMRIAKRLHQRRKK